MDSAALLRSFQCVTSPVKSVFERPGVIPITNAVLSSCGKFSAHGLAFSGKLYSSPIKVGGLVASCVKTAEAIVIAKSDGDFNGAVTPSSPQNESDEKRSSPRAYLLPDGIEELINAVGDTNDIAELKVKVGDFELLIKRKIEATIIHSDVASPVIVSSTPLDGSVSAAPPVAPVRTSSESPSPFININARNSAKLAALEASGASSYVLVSSPTVGAFRRGRTLKGKKQPPIVKEGDIIKEGQTIGFVDQLGTELPVKSDVAGEVLKLLYEDGEAIGFGDPLIAVRQ